MPSQDRQQWEEEVLKPTVARFPERREAFQTDSGLAIDPLYGPEGLAETGWTSPRTSVFRGNSHSPGESNPTLTAAASGPCASTPATAPPQRPTSDTATCWSRARRGCPKPSISPPRSATIRTIPWPKASGQGRSPHLQPGRHGDPVLGNSLGPGQHLDDDQRHGVASAVLLYRRRQTPGRGAPRDKRTVQNDILKEYIARGTYAYPPRSSMRLVGDVFKYCSDTSPSGTPSAYPATI